MLGVEEAANLTDVPNIRQKGTRLAVVLQVSNAGQFVDEV